MVATRSLHVSARPAVPSVRTCFVIADDCDSLSLVLSCRVNKFWVPPRFKSSQTSAAKLQNGTLQKLCLRWLRRLHEAETTGSTAGTMFGLGHQHEFGNEAL